MKHSFLPHGFLLFLMLIFLISSYPIAESRALIPKLGETVLNTNRLTPRDLKEAEDSEELMGMEGCDHEDEECLKRRMLSEAHLDYIYTQHHKP